MSIKVIFFFFQSHSLQNNAHGQEILCCPAYITLLSHTNSYSCRIQILYTVVHLRVQVTIYDHLFASLHCSVWTSCLFFFTELFFPFGALWRFSVVSPARRAFGYSRFPENETPLFFFSFLPLHAQSRVFRRVLWWFCLSVSDRVRQDIDHTSWGAQGVYLYLKTKFHFGAIVWEEHEK